MNREDLREISFEYEKRRDSQKAARNKRIEDVYEKIPAVRRIDEEISMTGRDMAKSILMNPSKYEEIAYKTKEIIGKLKMEKAFLLTEGNINPDVMELKYDCEICLDTGYIDSGERCSCLKQTLANKAYRMSNLEHLLKRENFQNFNINVYPDEAYPGERLTPKENMLDIVGIAEGFIDNFDENREDNLLFYGTTGLGKTYLCNCIAKALLDKGKTVIYQTAFTILDILEIRRFGKNKSEEDNRQYNMLFDADLLIIDDLGTEISNTFTNAEIFNIVNSRLIAGKKTIISTNLTPKEISEIYTDRVFSRIFHKFQPLKFYGKDIRWE